MHVLPEISRTLTNGAKEGFPDYYADAQNAIFVAGQYTTVSLLGDPSGAKPNLDRLADLDEVWAVGYRKPKPGWRLFGRFVATNVFVGTALWDRNVLGKTSNYTFKATDMLDDWTLRFPGLPIVRGQQIQDYLTGRTHDVDQPPF